MANDLQKENNVKGEVLGKDRKAGKNWFDYIKDISGGSDANQDEISKNAYIGADDFLEQDDKSEQGGERDSVVNGEETSESEVKRRYGQEAEGTGRGVAREGGGQAGGGVEENGTNSHGEETGEIEKDGGDQKNIENKERAKEDKSSTGVEKKSLEMQAQEEATTKEEEKKTEESEKQKKEGGGGDEEKKNNLDQSRAEDRGKEQENGEGEKGGENGTDSNKDGGQKRKNEKEKKSKWALLMAHSNILQIALVFDILAAIPFLSVFFNAAFRWVLNLYFKLQPKVEEKTDLAGDIKSMTNIKIFGISPKELLLYLIDGLIGLIPMNLWVASSKIFELQEQRA